MQHLTAMRMGPPIEPLHVEVFRLPTLAAVETDGTAAWSSTTMVMVQARAADAIGLGYSYVDAAAAVVIQDLLEPCVVGTGVFALPAVHIAMVQAVRNHGRHGIAACAIAAVDTALWDLQARLLGIPLCARLGAARDRVPVYASGGFTSTTGDALVREIESYRAAGHRRIKIKIGRLPEHDLERVRLARDAAGPEIELMVDANGAYTRKQARVLADELAALGVRYFEEPVSSDDLEGLRLLRDHSRLSVAAGEYGYDAMYFRRMLEAGAVDILQADATRCLGITGFLQADALCDAFGVPLSAHCAPALHAHAAAASRRLIHIEHFFDHVRMENLLFDGVPILRDGELWLDTRRPGHGLELRRAAALDLAA
jgi:L-alanine-DL-glutamate epimerase-like enolase superfamily enzyme